MHLEVEQIQRLLHGELDAPGRESVTGHLATCAECRSRLAGA
ncbi:MAG: zf-HC2 domain-containing protein, partial [Acidimicrobiales bacterium]